MKETRAEYLPIQKLRPFEGHPFKVTDNEEMDQLVWSVLTQGLLTPLVVRPLPNGEYEVVSGHRRLHACKKAGIETVPALIYAIDRDAAAIALVDSNLQREHILPSEKAFAYKLKLEAMNHQGRTSGQVGQKWTREEISDSDSGRQVQRYIRLTELIPEILRMVDDGRIALTPAVELSYLTQWEQRTLCNIMQMDGATPSLSQAQRMRRMSEERRLGEGDMEDIMAEIKGNQVECIRITEERFRKHFRRDVSPLEMAEIIDKALEYYQRYLDRQRDER